LEGFRDVMRLGTVLNGRNCETREFTVKALDFTQRRAIATNSTTSRSTVGIG
jgi:hypothetical protein